MDSLIEIKQWAENIAGSWNGDNAGIAEDRAGQANEILEAIKNLEELIAEMDEF